LYDIYYKIDLTNDTIYGKIKLSGMSDSKDIGKTLDITSKEYIKNAL
jgi:hypothetical protein